MTGIYTSVHFHSLLHVVSIVIQQSLKSHSQLSYKVDTYFSQHFCCNTHIQNFIAVECNKMLHMCLLLFGIFAICGIVCFSDAYLCLPTKHLFATVCSQIMHISRDSCKIGVVTLLTNYTIMM